MEWIFLDIGGVLGDESRFTEWRLANDLSIIQQYLPYFTQEDVARIFPRASAIIGPIDTNLVTLALADSPDLSLALQDLRASKSSMPDYYDWLEIRSEARGVLEYLSGKYRLGIMANQHERVRGRLQEANILQYFDHTGVSGDYRLEKPDPEFFRTILESTGADSRRSVFIDDNIERGLVPAKRLGMTSVWYRLSDRDDSLEDTSDHTITSLKDLLDIL